MCCTLFGGGASQAPSQVLVPWGDTGSVPLTRCCPQGVVSMLTIKIQIYDMCNQKSCSCLKPCQAHSSVSEAVLLPTISVAAPTSQREKYDG
jgi:hypothetical protein